MKALALGLFAISSVSLSLVSGACDPNFVNLYPSGSTEKCIFIDPLESGTFFDMRLFCSTQAADADLVQINTGNDLAAIITRLEEFGLDRSNYWIGASDEDAEGLWQWVSTVKPGVVPMGAPFWKYECAPPDFPLRPQLDTAANCAALDMFSHFRISDFDCLGDGGATPFSPICEQIRP